MSFQIILQVDSQINLVMIPTAIGGVMPATTDKVREARLRRQLDRMGYTLQKSRARDDRDITFGGYHIVDTQTGGLVAGWGNANRGYAFDLADVEWWISQP
jgi:hypothetical protein